MIQVIYFIMMNRKKSVWKSDYNSLNTMKHIKFILSIQKCIIYDNNNNNELHNVIKSIRK